VDDVESNGSFPSLARVQKEPFGDNLSRAPPLNAALREMAWKLVARLIRGLPDSLGIQYLIDNLVEGTVHLQETFQVVLVSFFLC